MVRNRHACSVRVFHNKLFRNPVIILVKNVIMTDIVSYHKVYLP